MREGDRRAYVLTRVIWIFITLLMNHTYRQPGHGICVCPFIHQGQTPELHKLDIPHPWVPERPYQHRVSKSWIDSTVGRVLALNASDLGSTLSTTYDPPSLLGVIP